MYYDQIRNEVNETRTSYVLMGLETFDETRYVFQNNQLISHIRMTIDSLCMSDDANFFLFKCCRKTNVVSN